MKKYQISIALILFSVSSLFAGESLFGISPKSIGMVSNPASAPGMARSFEIAAPDSSQINYLNFAQWTNIGFTSYSVKLGYNAADGEDNAGNTMFNDVAGFYGGFISIPVLKNKVAFGSGIFPYTNMEQRYKVEEQDSAFREILVKGGLNKAIVNLAYRPLQNLSVALTYEYSFGKVDKNFRYEEESTGYEDLKLDFEHRFYGHGVVFSAQYAPLPKLNLGLVYRPSVNLTLLSQATTNSDEVDESSEQELTLPSQFGFGAAYEIDSRWNAGFDLQMQDWKGGYKLDGQKVGSPFAQYLMFGGGIERKHSQKLFTSFFEKMDYRLGGYYRTLSQTSASSDVREMAITFGTSIPLQRFRSKIDFAGIVGTRGELSSNTYQETIYRFGVSVSAMERWFVKLKD